MPQHDDSAMPEDRAMGDDRLDERLIAFLDGESDEAEQAALSTLLENDTHLRDRFDLLSRVSDLARDSFADVLNEPVPAQLLALIRPPASVTEDEAAADLASSAVILPFRKREPKPERPRGRRFAKLMSGQWASLGAVAAMGILVIGLSVSLYIGHSAYQPIDPDVPMGYDNPMVTASNIPADTGSGSAGWMDTVAGYHNLFISSARGADNTVFDVTPHTENALPGDIRAPDLGQWGLDFQGARRIVLDGKPAFQFFYRPADASAAPAGIANASAPAKPADAAAAGKWRGPVTLFVTTGDQSLDRPERPPSFQRRDNVNLTYWRHRGHGYALVGQADKGWMFSVAGDIAFQTGTQ